VEIDYLLTHHVSARIVASMPTRDPGFSFPKVRSALATLSTDFNNLSFQVKMYISEKF
jgi:hypothetical protein